MHVHLQISLDGKPLYFLDSVGERLRSARMARRDNLVSGVIGEVLFLFPPRLASGVVLAADLVEYSRSYCQASTTAKTRKRLTLQSRSSLYYFDCFRMSVGGDW